MTATSLPITLLLVATALPLSGNALPAQARPADGERIARIYEVDLPAAAAAGPDLVLKPAGDPQPEARAEGPPAGIAAIARLAAAFVQPPLRDDESIQPLGERWLVALGRAEQHAWLDRFLAAARRGHPDPVRLRTQLYSLPELSFQRDVRPALQPDTDTGTDTDADAEATPGGAERPPAVPTAVVLDRSEATAAFLAALREHDDVEALATPDLMLRALTTGHVMIADQTSYVRDFEIEIDSHKAIANPIVDVVQDGVSVQAAAVPLESGRLGLAVELEVSDLKTPIPTFETRIGVNQKVEIQLPQVVRSRVEAAAELDDGQLVVLVLPTLAGTRHLAVVSRPETGDGR